VALFCSSRKTGAVAAGKPRRHSRKGAGGRIARSPPENEKKQRPNRPQQKQLDLFKFFWYDLFDQTDYPKKKASRRKHP
jgi:hypothetical protein